MRLGARRPADALDQPVQIVEPVQGSTELGERPASGVSGQLVGLERLEMKGPHEAPGSLARRQLVGDLDQRPNAPMQLREQDRLRRVRHEAGEQLVCFGGATLADGVQECPRRAWNRLGNERSNIVLGYRLATPIQRELVELATRIDIIESYNPWCDAAANTAAARLAEELAKVQATGSDSHSAEELGRSWMEIEEYSSTEDFLEKLRYARHVVTASSGTGRRA